MGILDDLGEDVFAALSGELSTGALRREIPGSGVDEWGDPLPGTVETYAFEGWHDEYDASWLAAGIPSTDSRIIILAGSISTEPKQGDLLSFNSAWWRIVAIEAIDPAGATFTLQVNKTEAPE